mgnify:FL=1|jgi:hypothetical protein
MIKVDEKTIINVTNWCQQQAWNIAECLPEVLSDPVTTQIINNWHSVF